MNWRRILALLLVASLPFLLTGSSCKKRRDTKKIQELSTDLCEIAADFNKLIVWRHFQPASMMVVPSKRIDFLVDAERYGGGIQIEDYAVVVCQVAEDPPLREVDLPSTDVPEDGAAPTSDTAPPRRVMDKEEALESVTKDPIPEGDKSLKDIGYDQPKQRRKPASDRVFYGTVLVRYMNRTILPSNSVDTKLIKQYWVAVDDVWYCDFDWSELATR
ncbi:MAG: hypothetical protein M5R36_26455 [Deltaproteobacteria bacterium]|nr:hypothetical protein [Deltaproteobacteria bacterium]